MLNQYFMDILKISNIDFYIQNFNFINIFYKYI